MSGNPAGRPRGIEARAREYTEEALEALVAALQNPKERVQAATVLLSYGWGKPKQVIEAESDTSVIALHLIGAQRVSRELLEQQTISLDSTAVAAEPQQPFDLLSGAPPVE